MNIIELDFRADDALETHAGVSLHPGRNILETEVWEQVKAEPLVRYRIDQGILKEIGQAPDEKPEPPNVIRTDPAEAPIEPTENNPHPDDERQ